MVCKTLTSITTAVVFICFLGTAVVVPWFDQLKIGGLGIQTVPGTTAVGGQAELGNQVALSNQAELENYLALLGKALGEPFPLKMKCFVSFVESN